MNDKQIRGKELGKRWALVIIEASHMMYNRHTQHRVLTALRDTLSAFLKKENT